jgi:alpha-glucosidase
MGTEWLADAIIYEIYPQSFADSNGDGIGDFRGVIDRLDHLAWLGVDTIWFNPCFDSPFVDAGYDVRDYLQVAPRYGTNDDLIELVEQAKQRGIRILLDLVAGHTSIEHEWFQADLLRDGRDPDGDRYVWCDQPPAPEAIEHLAGMPAWVSSPGPRGGYYLKNFYDEQPALNFGWANLHDDEPWRDAVDALGPRRNRQALRDIISFWLDRGVAGFRVDMAFSLVKDDPDLAETTALWREMHDWLAERYPDAILIPEGAEPRTGRPLAFHADFFLVIFQEHASLFDNGAAGRLAWTDHRPCFFDAAGQGSARYFIDRYERARAEDPDRLVILASADHDFDRMSTGPRTGEQLPPAYTFLFTWGTVPSLYYGDEIGMRYLVGAPDVEGAICNPAYNRAGCRTPMQWDGSVNAGFSTADPADLYLPIDPDDDRPTVAAQLDDPESLIHHVRAMIELRRSEPALSPHASTRVLHDGYPLAYVRGDELLVVINPSADDVELDLGDVGERAGASELLIGSGVTVDDGTASVSAFGHAVLRLPSATPDA